MGVCTRSCSMPPITVITLGSPGGSRNLRDAGEGGKSSAFPRQLQQRRRLWLRSARRGVQLWQRRPPVQIHDSADGFSLRPKVGATSSCFFDAPTLLPHDVRLDAFARREQQLATRTTASATTLVQRPAPAAAECLLLQIRPYPTEIVRESPVQSGNNCPPDCSSEPLRRRPHRSNPVRLGHHAAGAATGGASRAARTHRLSAHWLVWDTLTVRSRRTPDHTAISSSSTWTARSRVEFLHALTAIGRKYFPLAERLHARTARHRPAGRRPTFPCTTSPTSDVVQAAGRTGGSSSIRGLPKIASRQGASQYDLRCASRSSGCDTSRRIWSSAARGRGTRVVRVDQSRRARERSETRAMAAACAWASVRASLSRWTPAIAAIHSTQILHRPRLSVLRRRTQSVLEAVRRRIGVMTPEANFFLDFERLDASESAVHRPRDRRGTTPASPSNRPRRHGLKGCGVGDVGPHVGDHLGRATRPAAAHGS